MKLEPGNYEMVCTVGDHAELGMTGELEVQLGQERPAAADGEISRCPGDGR